MGNIDRILIGRLMSVGAVGYYSFARRLQDMAISSLSGVVTQFSFPFFAGGQDRAKVSARLFAVANFTYTITCPAFAGLAAVAPDLIPTLFGAKWAPAAPILQILALQCILSSTTMLHETLIKALGRADWWLTLAISGSVLNVMGYLVAAQYGLTAIAASILLVSCIALPIHWWMIWKLLSFDILDYMKIFAAPFLAAAGMAASVIVFRTWSPIEALPDFLRLLAEITFGLSIYVTVAATLFRERAMQIARFIIFHDELE